MPNLTLREYAELRHVSRQAVEKAIRDGRLKDSIVSTDPWMVDRYHADREWAANSNPIKGGAKRRRPDGSTATASEAAEAAREAGREGEVGGDSLFGEYAKYSEGVERGELAREKYLKAKVDREMAELNLQRAKGEVVDRVAAKGLWMRHWREMRDRVLAVADEADALVLIQEASALRYRLLELLGRAFDDLPKEPPAE